MIRKAISVSLVYLLIFCTSLQISAQIKTEAEQINALLEKSYLELFEGAWGGFSEKTVKDLEKQFKQEKKAALKTVKNEKKALKNKLKDLRKTLDDLNHEKGNPPDQDKRRNQIHCEIKQAQAELKLYKDQPGKDGDVVRSPKFLEVETDYDLKISKLKILNEWPARREAVKNAIANGTAVDRKFGNAEDIGVRDLGFGDQADDVKRYKRRVEEEYLEPLEEFFVQDEQVNLYVENMVRRIAAKSDVQIPLYIKVLHNDEINAFALPGGYVFINTGLILRAEKEPQLAGVIAHEMAHVAARHTHRMQKRGGVWNIVGQAAQIAVMVFLPGIGYLAYLGLQGIFIGLGLLMSLDMLGKSRAHETEADILGVQYAANAGYDPRGFVEFFEIMSKEKGLNKASFFRTHPATDERMMAAFTEFLYQPPREDYIVQTSDFEKTKRRLVEVVKEKTKENEAAFVPTMYPKDEEPECVEDDGTKTQESSKTSVNDEVDPKSPK